MVYSEWMVIGVEARNRANMWEICIRSGTRDRRLNQLTIGVVNFINQHIYRYELK